MSELSNYSIETDHTVVLAFKDGRRVRVPIGQLPTHLAPPDLEKVRSALRLRRDFIRRHMPKAALVLVAGGLIALLTVGGHAVAQLFWPPQAAPVLPQSTGIVRSEILQSPNISPAPHPSVKGSPTVAIARLLHSKKSSSKSSFKTIATSKIVPEPHVSPLPSDGPTPTPDPSPDPTPTPTPTPTPSLSPSPSPAPYTNGQVAGCSSTPSDPNPDCSMQ